MRLSRFLPCLLVVTTIPWLVSCADSHPADSDSPPMAADEPAEVEETAAAGACAEVPYVERAGAAQDAFTEPANFLRCTEGNYALCYYSGADPLPCELADDNTGNCQCQVFEASDDAPMYVEIGGILNQCVYDETVAQCGENGSGCQNVTGSNPDAPVAAVCGYIADGTFNKDAQFISTFSLETVSVPETGATFAIDSNSENGQYAGCMTAPCTGEMTDSEQNVYTTCACPLWPTDGSSAAYQFGRQCIDGEQDPLSPGYCGLKSDQVWSAAVAEVVTQAAGAD